MSWMQIQYYVHNYFTVLFGVHRKKIQKNCSLILKCEDSKEVQYKTALGKRSVFVFSSVRIMYSQQINVLGSF